MALIILEGPDGAGKTTLAHLLGEVLLRETARPTCDVRYEHAGPPRFHPLIEYEVPLVHYRSDHGQHVICDRWHLGELVYPTVLGRVTQLDDAVFAHVELFLRSRGAIVVHVSADPELIRRRVNPVRDRYVTPEQAIRAGELFEEVRTRTMLPRVDVHNHDADVDSIVKLALTTAERVAPLSSFVTYVGSDQPRVLLLGDVRGVDGKYTHVPVPAFMPYPSTSGHYMLRSLTTLLEDAEMIQLGVANACDVDDPRALWNALGRPETVALGRNAARAVPWVDRVVPHPQWVRRFKHRQGHLYAMQLVHGGDVSWS